MLQCRVMCNVRMVCNFLLLLFIVPTGSCYDLLATMSSSISKATGSPFSARSLGGGGYGGGGGGAATGVLEDEGTKRRFFYKSAGLLGFDMLRGEFDGVKALHETRTIKVPSPICVGQSECNSFVVFEYLQMGGTGDARTYASKLASLHRCSSPTGQFGFHVNNTCGATFQRNTYTASWAEFWDKHRLGALLTLARRDGADFPYEDALRAKVRSILEAHTTVQPVLCHGDLWSGNQGWTTGGEPCIFDPAAYYGDREVDIAMTKLFGSNSRAFYEQYDREIVPAPGWELRETVYNAYHILNHYCLFGGGYLQQFDNMANRILAA